MTVKYFKVPFALDGDRTSVPNNVDPTGLVSYEQGYTSDYQAPVTDPDYKPIERDKFNDIIYDVTLALQSWQQHDAPPFITSSANGGTAFSYGKNVRVYQPDDGKIYISLVDSNTQTPPGTNWSALATTATNSRAYNLTGSSNAYVLTPLPVLDAYTIQVVYYVIPNFTNTGPVTINVSGLGATPLNGPTGVALVGGEFVISHTYAVVIYQTEARLLNPTPLLASYYTTAGTSSAYTITTSQGIGAYVTGMRTTIIPNVNCSNSSTLAIDSLTPVALTYKMGIPTNNGSIVAGNAYEIEYQSGNWLILNPEIPVNISMGFSASAPNGSLPLAGGTVSLTSGATYSNPAYFRAYQYLWDNVSNAIAPVSGGRGANALADWNANKNITLTDFTGYSPMGVKAATSITEAGAKAGALTVTSTGSISGTVGTSGSTSISTSQIPSHLHNFSSDGTAFGQFGAVPPGGFYASSGDSVQLTPISKDTGNTGGGTSHNHTGGSFSGSFTGNATSVLQPSFGVYYYINY